MQLRRVVVMPGESAEFEVTLANLGRWPALFEISLEGWIDEAWTPDLPMRVQLEPQARQRVTLSVSPPRQPDCRAGEHALAVVVRAARYRFPLTLAIIGGDPRRFAPYVELYHRALRQLGHETLPVGIHSPGHIAESDAEAREQLWPAYQVMRNRIGAERGWPPTSRAEFDREVAEGSLYVGSPETVARKIAGTVADLGATRFDLKYSNGTLALPLMLRSIELYGREVIPRVRELLAAAPAEPMTAG